MPRALDLVLDERALGERPAGVGALGVEGEDRVAVADDDEVVDPGLELRRAALGDVGQAAEVERDPLRAGAAPGVAVDVGPDEVHEVAADRARRPR